MKFKLKSQTLALLLINGAFISTASASGFKLLEQNASGIGNAYAGSAVVAENASAAFFNPASMTYLPGLNISGGFSLVRPSFKFKDSGQSTGPLALNGGKPVVGGGSGGDAGNLGFLPNFHITYQATDDLFLGLSLCLTCESSSHSLTHGLESKDFDIHYTNKSNLYLYLLIKCFMSTIRVAIFAFDGINLFHLSIPSTVLCADQEHETIHYKLKYFSLKPGKLCSEQKVEITVDNGLEILKAADIIIIPAWHNPQEKAPEELAAALQQAHQRGSLIVGLCLGAFVLGDAGLLDGREATTHWASRETFVERFPASIFRPDVLYITDDNIITSAGTVAAIDCCLDLLRQRHGSEVANHTARLLVTPPHRSGGQAQYIERPLPKLTNDERIPYVMNWAPKNLQQPLSLDILVKKSNMSRRTFTRRFRETTGSTVTQWLNTERVCRAQQLQETTNLSIERISSEAGFSSALTMRQQFSKQLGTTPSAYRQNFYKQPDWPESI